MEEPEAFKDEIEDRGGSLRGESGSGLRRIGGRRIFLSGGVLGI